jgi:hypothetical protein
MRRRPSLPFGIRAGILLLLLLGGAAPPLAAQTVRERLAALGEQIPALRMAIERAQAAQRPPLTRAPPTPPAFLNDSIRRQVQAVTETYRAVDLAEGVAIAERMVAATARIDEELARFAETGDRQTLTRIAQPELSPLTLLARDWRLLRACCALDLAAPPVPTAPPQLTMPDVVGQDLRRARLTLSEVGLRVAGIDSMESDAGAGNVIGQEPPAGAVIEPGASARLTIATARPAPVPDLSQRPVVVPPAVDSALVPDVVTLTLADARDTLTARGLHAAVLPEQQDSSTWLVAGQNPPPDATVGPGTAVRLQLEPPAPAGTGFEGAGTQPGIEGAPMRQELPEPPFVEPAGGGFSWLPLLGGAILLLLGGLGGWWWRAARSAPEPPPSPALQPVSPPPVVVATTLRIPPGRPEIMVTDGRPLSRHEVLVGLRHGPGRSWVAAGAPLSSEE